MTRRRGTPGHILKTERALDGYEHNNCRPLCFEVLPLSIPHCDGC